MSWLHWALLSATFAGITAVLAKAGIGDVGSSLATAIRTSVVLVFAWGMAFALGETSSLSTLNVRHWMLLGFSGVATALSWLCYFRALSLGPASKVAPIDKLSVVFVLIFASFFLNEPMNVRNLLGAGLIIAGSLVIAL
jgi:transporter family protein